MIQCTLVIQITTTLIQTIAETPDRKSTQIKMPVKYSLGHFHQYLFSRSFFLANVKQICRIVGNFRLQFDVDLQTSSVGEIERQNF